VKNRNNIPLTPLNFLEKSEGNRPMVYLDRDGNPTIGSGSQRDSLEMSDDTEQGAAFVMMCQLTQQCQLMTMYRIDFLLPK